MANVVTVVNDLRDANDLSEKHDIKDLQAMALQRSLYDVTEETTFVAAISGGLTFFGALGFVLATDSLWPMLFMAIPLACLFMCINLQGAQKDMWSTFEAGIELPRTGIASAALVISREKAKDAAAYRAKATLALPAQTALAVPAPAPAVPAQIPVELIVPRFPVLAEDASASTFRSVDGGEEHPLLKPLEEKKSLRDDCC